MLTYIEMQYYKLQSSQKVLKFQCPLKSIPMSQQINLIYDSAKMLRFKYNALSRLRIL